VGRVVKIISNKQITVRVVNDEYLIWNNFDCYFVRPGSVYDVWECNKCGLINKSPDSVCHDCGEERIL